MGLDLEYFKNQMHINDLLKLNEELEFIIRLLQDELNEININSGSEVKDIIKTCGEAIDLLKDFRFILCGYIDVINENDLSFCDITETEQLINKIDTIKEDLKTILETKIVKLTKNKYIDLVDICILYMRVFYGMMEEYIIDENNLWEAERSRQERINRRKCYMSQDKFNIDKQE